jgi:hypothetical protein
MFLLVGEGSVVPFRRMYSDYLPPYLVIDIAQLVMRQLDYHSDTVTSINILWF